MNKSDMVARLVPPSEAAGLGVRAQHIRRWEVPRSSCPMTKR